MQKKSIMVIDPSIETPEISSFNHIGSLTSIQCTYHLPALIKNNSMEFEFPNTQGIIIMGSASSVHDNLIWQADIQKLLLKSIENNIPILGICYGHQLIAHMFGGNVDNLWENKKKKGTRIVTLLKNELWTNSKTGQLIYSHRESVTSCPNDFEISARSEMVSIEGLIHKNKPIWTFQPHIEATFPFAERNLISTSDFEISFQFGTTILKKFIQLLTS